MNHRTLLGDDDAGWVLCALVTRVTDVRTRPELLADTDPGLGAVWPGRES
ncbi:MAG: hypothetical protein WDO69_30275 [Pseudomonadota bacterium]